MSRHVILLLAMLASRAEARAQPGFEPDLRLLDACQDGPAWTPTSAAICANQGTRAADARIAILLRQARRPPVALYAVDLAAAQRHWQRYRDLHCRLYDRRDGAPQGSQTPAEIASCRFDRTLRREAELRAVIHAMGPR